MIGLPALIGLIFTEYGVTSKRVVLKKGFIARKTEEMKNAKVETVEISQGILGRITAYRIRPLTVKKIRESSRDRYIQAIGWRWFARSEA